MGRKRGAGRSVQFNSGIDNRCELFVKRKVALYMIRFLARYRTFPSDIFRILYWILDGEMLKEFLAYCSLMLPDTEREGFMRSGRMVTGPTGFTRLVTESCLELVRDIRDVEHKVVDFICGVLERRRTQLKYSGKADLENRLILLRKMFNLSSVESEMLLFFFITAHWDEAHTLLNGSLKCDEYRGRRYLAAMLDCTGFEIAKALNGRLGKIGIFELAPHGLAMELTFVNLLQNASGSELQTEFFKKVKPNPVPLEAHSVDHTVTEHILDLLSHKPTSSTHILLYGPPGTGKTSYAYGLGTRLRLPTYLVEHGGKSKGHLKRAAVTASVVMASQGRESLLIADDSDSILATRDSWSLFGHSPDKRWLHDILETPGVRMIWTVNSVDNIEESVMRRFAFSVYFRNFGRGQRIRVWETALRRHKVKRAFTTEEIKELAGQFDTNPGVIDQAIRKAAETARSSKTELHQAIVRSLEAHQSLLNQGVRPIQSKGIDPNFTLDGLNVVGTSPGSLLKELETFSEHLNRGETNEQTTMSLLFHGPPGTGKSHFSRYIGQHLDREVVCKRASDVFSKWLGETEQNIRMAYDEARDNEAVLVFDEADSFIINRGMAEHSWEHSFTNEFLRCMEEFNGIQIFTTNRLTDLDTASLRRFNHKLQFGYLKPEGNIIFYSRLLAGLVHSKMKSQIDQELMKFSRLTPGDFKAVRDRFSFKESNEVTHEAMLEALRGEERLKLIHAGEHKIGFIV